MNNMLIPFFAAVTNNIITALGLNALRSNTTGSNNSAVGVNALHANTTGSSNSAVGVNALHANTTGTSNSAVGVNTLLNNTTGSNNSAVGVNTLLNNTTGTSNSAVGANALHVNTTGSNNSAIGFNAGRFIADGVTSNITPSSSSFIGTNTRALADAQTNQIVIGNDAIGSGSNSVTLGNAAIVTTVLRANVGIGTTVPSAPLDVNGNTIRVRTARTPTSTTAPGNVGDICWDANFVYVCIATNTWRRSALTAW